MVSINEANRLGNIIKDQYAYVKYYTGQLRNLFITSQSVPRPSMFTSKTEFKQTQQKLYKNFGVRPTAHIKNLKVKATTTENSYDVVLTIPLDLEKTKSDVIEIVPFPIHKGNDTYLPNMPFTLFAKPMNGQGFYTPIRQNELSSCLQQPFCQLSSPTYKKQMASCGISNYFTKKDNCQYVQINHSDQNFYFTIEDKTYFSIKPNKTETIDLICVSPTQRDVTPKVIKDQGYLTIPLGCLGVDT